MMGSRKPSSSDRLIDRGQEVDRLIKAWFQRSGAESAKPKDLMPYLIQQGFFSKDHREGYPLRRLLNQLHDAGKLSVITTAGFDQKAKNKNWYFVRP